VLTEFNGILKTILQMKMNWDSWVMESYM